MKYIILSIGLLVFTASCTGDSTGSPEERKVEYAKFIDNPTTISYEESTFDFGTVVEGEQVRHTYKFTNTGDQPLILIGVTGSCGCTVPEEWPTHPIQPGESGEIKVVFDSNARVGNVRKNVRVEANTNPSTTSVELTGIVKVK